jgi:hypothetical protein
MSNPIRHDIAPRPWFPALCVPLLLSSATLPSFDSEPALETPPQAESLAPLGRLVIQSSGAIETDVNAFRALLGNPLNGATPGQQPAGRREINWDGVPAAVTNTLHFPNAFFNTNSPRGLVYDLVNRGLEVSDNGFLNINPTYPAEFKSFSGLKTFSTLGDNESDLRFFVAGSSVPAGVRGFGVVFMDVDIAGKTGFELIGVDGTVLDRFFAPVRSDARGASFLGVVYRNPVIGRVRIVAGDGRLGADQLDISQGGQHDLVVMDDFIYGEPIAIQ